MYICIFCVCIMCHKFVAIFLQRKESHHDPSYLISAWRSLKVPENVRIYIYIYLCRYLIAATRQLTFSPMRIGRGEISLFTRQLSPVQIFYMPRLTFVKDHGTPLRINRSITFFFVSCSLYTLCTIALQNYIYNCI